MFGEVAVGDRDFGEDVAINKIVNIALLVVSNHLSMC